MNEIVDTTQVVVHLMASPFFGGPERQVLGLARHLPAAYSTCFLSFAERGLAEPFTERARAEGFQTFTLRNNVPNFRACIAEVAHHLRSLGADVLCCHGYKADLIGLPAARRVGLPVVSISRGWTGATWKVRFNEGLDRLSLHGMDHVVCVSDGQAAKVRKAAVPRHRISVIRNAIDPSRFASRVDAGEVNLRLLFPRPLKYIIAAAGRLSPEKGFASLIDAAADVVARQPAAGFVVFGDGPLLPDLARQIVDRKLDSNFVLAGFRSDVDDLLPHADLVAIPSFTEGLPNIALEAQAAGIPVVGTAVGGIPEVVADGVTGHLVRAGDSQSLADRIVDLLNDDRTRRQMGLLARERMQSLFTFEAQSQQYQALFERLLPHHQGPAPALDAFNADYAESKSAQFS